MQGESKMTALEGRAQRPMGDRFLIVCFALAIGLPGLLSPLPWLWPDGPFEDPTNEIQFKELRNPESRPSWTGFESLREWPKEFDAWFGDRFAFRKTLIGMHSLLYMRSLHQSPNDRFLVGKDGWVFRSDVRYIENYRSTEMMSRERMEEWRSNLQAKQDFLSERGINYVFMFAPQKSTIYPEYLPDWLTRVGPESRMDQLLEYLAANSSVRVLDLRPALLAAKEREQVYFPLGSHWNDLGAFAAYEVLGRRLREWYPQFEIKTRGSMAKGLHPRLGDDLSYGLYLKGWQTQENPILRHMDRKHPRPKINDLGSGVISVTFSDGPPDAPRAVLLRDSFGDYLGPYLAPHFSRLTLIVSALDKRHAAPERELEFILSEQPDVLIEELAEMSTVGIRPSPDPWSH